MASMVYSVPVCLLLGIVCSHVSLSGFLRCLEAYLAFLVSPIKVVCSFSGTPFFMSKSTAPGLLGSGWLDLPRTLLVSSSILIIVCVASAVDLFFLKPFWFSSNAPISSAHSLILEASTLAMIRLAKGRRQMPL